MPSDERDDERDPRDTSPDERPTDDADEFETAPWPVQDSTERSDIADAPPPSGDEDDRSVGDQGAVDAPARLPGDAGPPPPEVEAHGGPSQGATAPASQPAHTVPATEPGESTRCARCGTENRPGIAFCRNCGQRLLAAGAPATVQRPSAPEGTETCPRCGTHNRAGVTFCQNCGANMRAPEPGEVPAAEAARTDAVPRGGALLGPVVLLIGAVGVAVGWLLPFPLGSGSLFDRAFGSTDGYGVAFWSGYDQIQGIVEQAYFGFAAPSPLLILLLVALSIGGFLRAQPGWLQRIGLAVALVWALGLAVLFVIVEVVGGPGGDLLDILRALSPGGIIFLLAGLIVLIGTLTRFARG